MAHVLARQRHDLDAAIGQLQQQALGRQQPERFAQRRARQAELLAELALVQPRAGREVPSMIKARSRSAALAAAVERAILC